VAADVAVAEAAEAEVAVAEGEAVPLPDRKCRLAFEFRPTV